MRSLHQQDHFQRIEGLKRRIVQRGELISKVYNDMLLGTVSSEYDTVVSILGFQPQPTLDTTIE